MAKNSIFDLLYTYEGEKSHLVVFMHKDQLMDIQYIRNIKKNKSKSKNIMKLNKSLRRTSKAAKSLEIGTNGQKIDDKWDCTTKDAKSIIILLWAFYIYMQILVFWAALGNKLKF